MKKYQDGGEMKTPKTRSRANAERMERYRMTPGAKVRDQAKGMVGPDILNLPSKAYDTVRSVVSPRKARSSEEMSELTREVARGINNRGVKRPAARSKQTLTPQEQQMMQEAKDKKNQPKIDEAYEKSRTTFKQGGSVSKRADGCAQRGKTNCKIC